MGKDCLMARKLNKKQVVGFDYTSTEQDTGEKWIDGRIVYRKVVTGNFNCIAGTIAIAHGISGLTTSHQVISLTGSIKLGAATGVAAGTQSLAYRESGGNFIHWNGFDQTSFSLQSSFAWGSSWVTVVMTYVK